MDIKIKTEVDFSHSRVKFMADIRSKYKDIEIQYLGWNKSPNKPNNDYYKISCDDAELLTVILLTGKFVLVDDIMKCEPD